MKLTNKGERATGFMIDLCTIMTLNSICIAIISNFLLVSHIIDLLLYLILSFFYYFVCECVWQRTLGKRIMKTQVVSSVNTAPTIYSVFIRSLLRFNPLDVYSYAFGKEVGIHEYYSDTRVIKVDT